MTMMLAAVAALGWLGWLLELMRVGAVKRASAEAHAEQARRNTEMQIMISRTWQRYVTEVLGRCPSAIGIPVFVQECQSCQAERAITGVKKN